MRVPTYFGRLAIAVSGPVFAAAPTVHAAMSLELPAPAQTATIAQVCCGTSPSCLFRDAGCAELAHPRDRGAMCKMAFDSRALSAAPSDLALARVGLDVEMRVWSRGEPGAANAGQMIVVVSRSASESVATAPATLMNGSLGSARAQTSVSEHFGAESIAAFLVASPVH